MKLIDTHAHLDFEAFDSDRGQVMDRARAAGVERIITIGIDLETSSRAVELAESNNQVWATVGIHPHDCSHLPKDYLEQITRLSHKPKVVAVGETGLDFYRNYSPRKDQEQCFRNQLQLAAQLDLPVVLHFREACSRGLEILRQAGLPPAGGVMHCYSGGPELLPEFLSLGLYISFAGPVTFGNAASLRDVAKLVPGDRLLWETDCPFLSPEPFRGKRNEPARVALVAGKVAELRGEEPEQLARQTWDNACRLFRLPLK